MPVSNKSKISSTVSAGTSTPITGQPCMSFNNFGNPTETTSSDSESSDSCTAKDLIDAFRKRRMYNLLCYLYVHMLTLYFQVDSVKKKCCS